MKIETKLAIVLAIVAISGCTSRTATTTTTAVTTVPVVTTIPVTTVPVTLITTTLEPSPPENENSCASDSDCACGVHFETGDCFYGNRHYVDATKQCPDFCSGFTGRMSIRCVDGECKQAQIT